MKPRILVNLTAAWIIAIFAGSAALADGGSWSQWGGPNRNFAVEDAEAAVIAWEGSPLVLWERELGPGYSGIVSDGQRLITMTRRGDQEVVIAICPTSGATLWEYTYPAPTGQASVGDHSHLDTTWGSGPNGTPLLTEGRVYTLGFTGVLNTLDAATGKLVWSHDLASEPSFDIPFFGLSTSPIRYGDLVIVIADGAFAFDLESGKKAWGNREFEGSYASPALLERGGRTHLIAPVAGEVVSLDPATGTLLWRHELANQHRTILSAAIFGNDDLLFASAYFLGSVGLRLAADGTGVTKVWESSRMQLSNSNSIRVGKVVYGFHNSILKAIDVTSGEILWRSRDLQRGNLIRIGDRFLLFDKHGKLSLVSLTPEGPSIHAEAQILEGRSWTAPTLVGNRLYARNLEKIIAADLGRPGSAAARSTVTARRKKVPAPPEFLAAKAKLMEAFVRADSAALARARNKFFRWENDADLGSLTNYYLGLAAFKEASSAQTDLAQLEAFREAETRLTRAIEGNKTLADAHALLARIYPMYYHLDPRRAAVVGPLGDEHLETAFRLEPANPRVLAIRGLDLLYSPAEYGGDPEAGMEFLRRAIDKFDAAPMRSAGAEPDWGAASVRFWYAQALQRTKDGDRGKTIEALRRALELEPQFADAKTMLESLLEETNN